jgi:hypothetical protein
MMPYGTRTTRDAVSPHAPSARTFHRGASRIVGGFAKFSRGSVDLENTLGTAIGEDDVVSVKAGGFQVGGGLRLKF